MSMESDTSASVAPRPAPRSGVVQPHPPRWYQRALARLLYELMRLWVGTLRVRWHDRSGFFTNETTSPAIYVVWHNRLALCMEAYFGYVKKRNQTPGMAAMVSASKDGALLAGILECFGVRPVRGSTSRRGRQALLELKGWAEQGYDLAITPDGPRGPREVVQEGVVALSQVTGLPIMPVSYNLGWKIRVNSWDRFQVPLPFSRCEMIFERPIRVSREASPEERERARLELENVMRSISQD